MVSNTWFEHEKRRRYTWKRPGDTGRFQIDYILVKQRYRNSVKNSRTYPGADANTDHNLVMANIKLKLKKIRRAKKVRRWCLKDLGRKKALFQEEVQKEISKDIECKDESVEMGWERLKEAIKTGAEKVLGFQKANHAKKPWVTEKMIEKMEERRKWKRDNTEEGKKNYKRLHNELRRETDKARED